MHKLNKSFVEKLILRLKKRLQTSDIDIHCDDIIGYLKALSFLYYKFYIGYKNDTIEGYIDILSHRIIRKDYTLKVDSKFVVFVDNLCADSIGLTQQYIDALISNEYHILYIYREEFPSQICTKIMHKLKSYNKSKLLPYPPRLKGMKLSQWLYDSIVQSGSSKLILHSTEWPIEESIAMSALPEEIIRYKVDLADHTFWAGVGSFDYIFDFRYYGCNMSFHKRGLKKEQVIYMPFYPVMNNMPFDGYPKETEGKFVFLSGGSIYKVVGQQRSYFRICKEVLKKCPNSVILFAGGLPNNPILSDGIKDFCLEGRFIPIGYRKDIFEVFKHCDAYLDTYPIGGGLMLQYAAQCSKPILLYKNKDLEECICQKISMSISHNSLEKYVEYAFLLYSDDEYRQEQGVKIKNATISRNEFDDNFHYSFHTNVSVIGINWDNKFTPRLLNMEDAINFNNTILPSFYFKLYTFLGINFLRLSPINYLSLLCWRVNRKLKSLIVKQ